MESVAVPNQGLADQVDLEDEAPYLVTRTVVEVGVEVVGEGTVTDGEGATFAL